MVPEHKGKQNRMMGPRESERYLLDQIKQSGEVGFSLDEAVEIERRPDVFLGPETNAFYTLIDFLTEGLVDFNEETGKFTYHPQESDPVRT